MYKLTGIIKIVVYFGLIFATAPSLHDCIKNITLKVDRVFSLKKKNKKKFRGGRRYNAILAVAGFYFIRRFFFIFFNISLSGAATVRAQVYVF